jgi:HK97 family phage prohead protease
MTSIRVRALAGLVARTTARVIAELKRGNWNTADDLATLRLPWYEVRNEGHVTADGMPVENGDSTIFIYDEIGGSLGIDANDLVQEIQAITAPTITVRINSPGGSVRDAIAIYNALNHHPANKIVYVDSVAASAASVIAMAGNEIVMMPGSQMMIHDASATDAGNAEDHRKIGTWLDRQSDNLAEIYQLRAGGTVDKWRSLMLDETWAFAQESVDLGLADRVQAPPARPEPVTVDEGLETQMTRSFDLSHYRYAGRENAPAPGKGNHQHRATTQSRDLTRADAAEARKRAFLEQSPVTMPDRTQRQQTRSMVLGHGADRRVPFGGQLRGELETKQGRELYHLSGYATVFDRPYQMWDSFGEYEEVVTRGAADLTLSRNPDVSFLVNHLGTTMARTSNGTLELSANATGLFQDAWVNPKNRTDVQILIAAVEDGLIDEMSFAFMIPDEGGHWSDDFSRFEIRQFDLNRGDVSAVNYGANPFTSISARAREIMTHVDMLPEGMRRAFAAKLGGRAERWQRALESDVRATPALAAPAVTGREPVPDKQGRALDAIERLLKN